MRKYTMLFTVLALFAFVLAACGGAAPAAEVAPTAAAVEEAVEEVAEEAEVVEEAVEEVAPTEEPAMEEPTAEPAAEEPAAEEATGDRTVVRWFVGLGTGGNEAQIEAQDGVVEAFNASQDEIELQVEYIQNDVAADTLATLIAAGDAPDIVGPVGTGGSNAFAGTFLDLSPLVESTGYDLSQYPQATVDFYRTPEGILEGLPFAVFPAMIYYNRDHFDEAGLNYPPHAVGEPYVMPDGTELPWTFETLAEVAKLLTVDANGNDANSADFDPEAIVQFGYHDQWLGDFRSMCQAFGADAPIDADGNARWPESYQECIEWQYPGIWESHFQPNQAQMDSELLSAPNQFGSGNISMAQTHLWFTCCIVDAPVENWDLAVVPTNAAGVTTSKLHADTFRILNTTENPEAAFEVLTYLIGEAAPELTLAYGALPIREAEQADFFAAQDVNYPQGVDWSVVNESLAYPDIPNHEAYLPNYNQAVDRLNAFVTLFRTDGTLDLDAEVELLVSDLQAIYDASGE